VHGLVAEQEDQLAGLAHLVLHPATWATHPTCYLEDLYVGSRGAAGASHAGSSRQSMHFADGFGPASVYWLTPE
jgi:hypothetical protein